MARGCMRGRSGMAGMNRWDWRRGLLLGAEPVRAASELASSALLTPLLAVQPRADGHCVLVIPGWLAGDRSTLPLRRYLKALGYEVHGWGQGVNRGRVDVSVAALRRRLSELARSSGGPVSVIGWSLGGYYACQLARRDPKHVRQVITLGSPATLRWSGANAGFGPLRMPVTAIHSRSDPIVAWRPSRAEPAAQRQDIRVHGSHLGLGHNPAVLWVVADRLSTPPQRWKPYRPGPLLKPFFPSP
jgi:pimeloyl-ACP methyl ester carboxylesterase